MARLADSLLLTALLALLAMPAWATDDGGDVGSRERGGQPLYLLPRPRAVVNDCEFRQAATYTLWNRYQRVLGNPVSHEQVGTRSPQGTDATFMLFERGSIVCLLNGPRRGQAFVLHGGIGQKYSDFAGPRGWLGHPIGNEFAFNAAGHDAQHFEGGTIAWDDRAGDFVVTQK